MGQRAEGEDNCRFRSAINLLHFVPQERLQDHRKGEEAKAVALTSREALRGPLVAAIQVRCLIDKHDTRLQNKLPVAPSQRL